MNVLRVSRYRVLQRLGAGGSSDVYLAEDTVIRRKVALKILRRRDDDSENRRSFDRELRCASVLNHPNIVTVLDVGVEGDFHFIVSEYVEGETLRQRLAHGALPFLEAVDVAIGIAKALVAAHEAWIVHRDVKPENVLLRRDQTVKVADFGIATLVGGSNDATDPLRRPGSLAGSLHYLSPEQVRGEPIIDTRSDIYSLGVVLYEMLSGDPPFTGGGAMDVLAAIVEANPKPLPPFVPHALAELVSRAMRKSIYERTQTTAELFAQLTDVRLDLALQQRADGARVG
jgi:serine/threonine-protein kinase